MKRMIVATKLSSTDGYKRTKAYNVTSSYLSGFLKGLDDCLADAVVRGVLTWKNMNSIVYHHNDKNTANSSPDNIILMDTSAHPMLHQNMHKFYAIKDKATSPMPIVGPLSEETERKIIREVGLDLGFDECSVHQIIDALTSAKSQIIDLYQTEPETVSYDVIEILDTADIHFVKGTAVRNYLRKHSQKIDYAKYDVIYIDEDSAAMITKYADKIIHVCLERAKYWDERGDAHKRGWYNVRRKSFEALKTFVQENTRDFDLVAKEHEERPQQ